MPKTLVHKLYKLLIARMATEKPRDERIQAVIEEEQKVDTTIDPQEIGKPNGAQLLSLKCNLYLHKLLDTWALEQEEGGNDILKDTKRGIYPLLVSLRKARLPSDQLISLATVLYHLQQYESTRDKVHMQRSLESYMKLSLGNVAWPIGVTQVGIHERKIQRQDARNNTATAGIVANVMTDEQTRLWITNVKRLLTHMEQRK